MTIGIDLIRCRRVAEQYVQRIAGDKMDEDENEDRGRGQRCYSRSGPMQRV
jgi:hypothetical protein